MGCGESKVNDAQDEPTPCQLQGRRRVLKVLQRQKQEADDAVDVARRKLSEATANAEAAAKLATAATQNYQSALARGTATALLDQALQHSIATGTAALQSSLKVDNATTELHSAEARSSRATLRLTNATGISENAKRLELASYLGWPVVGRLEAVVKHAESTFLEKTSASTAADGSVTFRSSKASGEMRSARDAFPFYYVMNPPRHGKSLFLDRLFRSHPDVVVAPVSYNGVDGIQVWETESAQAWWRGFQSRVAWGILGGPFKQRGEEWADFDMNLSAWPKRLVILVDEFSNVTDTLTQTDEATKTFLYGQMWGLMHATQGRIYMTGFNQGPSSQAVASTFAVFTASLPQCEPSEAETLGLFLYHVHGAERFPYFIYELCKSTPGLLGTLANIVVDQKKRIRDDLRSEFLRKAINWMSILEKNAAVYWPVIAKVMKGDTNALDVAQSHALTVLRNDRPALSPFAVAVIVTYLKDEDGVTDRELLASVRECVNICKTRRTEKPRKVKELPAAFTEWVQHLQQALATTQIADDDQMPEVQEPPAQLESGKTFELFTAQAMHARLLCGGALLRECDVVVPAPTPKDTSLTPVHIGVHILADRASLEELLGAVPYALFPCGYELLSTPLADAEARPPVAFHALDATQDQAVGRAAKRFRNVTEKVDTTTLSSFPCELGNSPMQLLVAPPNLPPAKGSVSEKLRSALVVADLMIPLVETCGKKGVSFIAVPKDACNAYCDVVAILATEDGWVDIAMVECRDRREMRIDDYVKKVRQLVAARTLIPYLNHYFATREPQVKVRWRYVLAGRCDKSPSAAQIALSLAQPAAAAAAVPVSSPPF